MTAPIPITLYQPGGRIYNELALRYGVDSANLIARAAATGDRGELGAAIARASHGAPLQDSLAAIFAEQIITEPLDAPLEALDAGIARVLDSPGIRTLLLAGGVLLAAALLWKMR